MALILTYFMRNKMVIIFGSNKKDGIIFLPLKTKEILLRSQFIIMNTDLFT